MNDEAKDQKLVETLDAFIALLKAITKWFERLPRQ